MGEPIELLIQGDQLKKAVLQDAVIRIIFRNTKDAVFHGGTCIWRCYDGKRFSKDIDMYVSKESSIDKIRNRLMQEGFKVLKDDQRKGTSFYTVRNSTDISMQLNKLPKAIKEWRIAVYNLADGTLMNTHSLSAEDLVFEKIYAYEDRMLERDLYDIMVLVNKVQQKDTVRERLSKFLGTIKPPRDEGALEDLIYDGLIPKYPEIVEYLNRWCKL